MILLKPSNISISKAAYNAIQPAIWFGGIVISSEVAAGFQYLFYSVLCQGMVVFGISANIVNVVCFVKQGFKDPVNISLLALAVSDIGCLSTFIWLNICCTPAFTGADLPFDPLELQYLTTAVPHTVFSRVTGCITAFITLERCLCIIAPLKVKRIITPKRTFYIAAAIFFLMICSAAPEYVVSKIGSKFVQEKNRTLIGIVYASIHESVLAVSYLVNNVMVPFVALATSIVCTLLLVFKLQSSVEWRKKSTPKVNVDNVLHRNQKISKLVLMISGLFILCYVPMSVTFIAMSQVKEFSLSGKYRNVVVTLGGVGIVLEATNSSMNIFFYYFMSTKYRLVFHAIFKIGGN